MSDDARQASVLAVEAKMAAKAAKAAPEAPAIPVTPAAPPAPEAPEAPAADTADAAPPETPEGDQPDSAPEVDPLKIAKNKNRKLQRQIRKAQEQASYWRGMAEKPVASQPQPAAQPHRPDPLQEPQLADFNYDQAAHQTALRAWDRQQAVAEFELRQKAQQQTQSQAQKQAAFSKRLQAFEAKQPGAWQEVVTAPINTSDAMVEFIAESDTGPELAFYLAKHPDEANAIAQMSAVMAGRALDRIESKLTAAPAVRVAPKNPPPPPPPSLPSGPSGSTPVERWGMEDHMKRVRERKAQKFS